MKEKVVPLTLRPSSTWMIEQNLSGFLLLLAVTDETAKHELNEAFLESLEYTSENLYKRLSKIIYEAPAKSVSFNLNENIEYEEDNELKEELVEYRKSVGMNLYYYFRRMERDERRERRRRLKRVLTYPWRAMTNVFRRRRRRTMLVDNI